MQPGDSKAPSSRYVLLGDVIGSREITDRDSFRKQLRDTRETVTESYEESFATPLSALKGIDEIGAVLTSIEHLYDIVVALTDRLRPHSIRLAVASGEIEFGVDDQDVSQMDGEAFHRATELLKSIERTGLRFDLDTETAPLDTAVADEINLLLHLRESWTDRQRDVVELYERTGKQQAVADDLDVSQQAVSNALRDASWPLAETIETRLRRTLEAYGR